VLFGHVLNSIEMHAVNGKCGCMTDDVSDGALMLVMLGSADEDRYLSVTLTGGSQLLMMQSGKVETVISTEGKMKLNDAEWHEINVEFDAGTVSVVLNHVDCSECSAVLSVEDSAAVIYFGSAAESVQRGYEGFVGCMRDIQVNSDWLAPSWLAANWNASANVSASCGWSENCEPDPCNGQGSCTDLWTHSSCRCRSPFWGSSCSRGTCVCVVPKTNKTFHTLHLVPYF